MNNKMTNAPLLPCPFCGQQDAFVEQLDSDASVVICQGRVGEHSACLARGPVGVQQHDYEDQPGHDEAVKEWNRRAAAQHQVEHTAVGFLKRMLKGSGDDRLAAWQGEMAMLLEHISETKPQGEPVCKRCGDSGVIDDKDQDELPSGHYVEKGLVSCPECEEQRTLLAKPDPNTDVRTILLDVVPGDGDGREVYATCCDDIVTMLSDQADRIEELEAAQPQGEPVAWAVNRGGVLELFNSEGEALDDLKEWRKNAPPHDVSVGPVRLYTEQPAPVAVVLPERDESIGTAERDEYANGYRHGWNAYHDAAQERLNPGAKP